MILSLFASLFDPYPLLLLVAMFKYPSLLTCSILKRKKVYSNTSVSNKICLSRTIDYKPCTAGFHEKNKLTGPKTRQLRCPKFRKNYEVW